MCLLLGPACSAFMHTLYTASTHVHLCLVCGTCILLTPMLSITCMCFGSARCRVRWQEALGQYEFLAFTAVLSCSLSCLIVDDRVSDDISSHSALWHVTRRIRTCALSPLECPEECCDVGWHCVLLMILVSCLFHCCVARVRLGSVLCSCEIPDCSPSILGVPQTMFVCERYS